MKCFVLKEIVFYVTWEECVLRFLFIGAGGFDMEQPNAARNYVKKLLRIKTKTKLFRSHSNSQFGINIR